MTKNKQKLLKYLKSRRLMVLATYSEKPWICTVFYVIDDKFNLYFLSKPHRRHCKDIVLNNSVSCAVADSNQKVIDKKIGVQIQGIANKVGNIEKIKWMLKLWNKLNPGFESTINLKNIKEKAIESRIYKIEPREIKFFNEELYGMEGSEVFKFD